MEIKNNKLYFNKISAEQIAKKYGTPVYVYEAATIWERYKSLVDHIQYPHLRIHYAAKANANPAILKIIKSLGGGIEAVSKGKIEAALKVGFKPEQIIYTCNGAEKSELQYIIDKGIRINIDSLEQLETWGQLNPNSKVSLRLNLDIGAGSHIYVTTGGQKSKFGIHISNIKNAKKIANKYNLTIAGIHQHIGSGVLNYTVVIRAMKALMKVAHQFGDLEFIDFGGGFGVPYKPDQKPFDTKAFGQAFDKTINKFVKEYGKELEVIIEPGRYLVAESGVLLAKVTDIKSNPSRTFVSINTGLNHLIRQAMYFAYQKVSNASHPKNKRKKVTIVGNICESADIFAEDRMIATPKKGDLIAIHDSGAYGYTMSSFYNARVRPPEVLIDKGKSRLIRKRQNLEDALPFF